MNETEAKTVIAWKAPYVICPTHGRVESIIHSTIPGHEGHWCQICLLDLLGPPLKLHEAEK